jgi:hypothetical protein
METAELRGEWQELSCLRVTAGVRFLTLRDL